MCLLQIQISLSHRAAAESEDAAEQAARAARAAQAARAARAGELDVASEVPAVPVAPQEPRSRLGHNAMQTISRCNTLAFDRHWPN